MRVIKVAALSAVAGASFVFGMVGAITVVEMWKERKCARSTSTT